MAKQEAITIHNATMRDYFAVHAPQPDAMWMDHWRARERAKSRRDDRYQERSEQHGFAEHAFEYADAMLKVRGG